MLLDAQALFSDAQAVTATANSTNVYDLQVNRDVGPGGGLLLVILVNVAATASGSATVTFSLVAADDAALTSNVTTLWTSTAIGKASLTVGTKVPGTPVVVPRVAGLGQRYLGVIYTVATGPLTAGKFTAALTLQGQDDSAKFYPRAGYGVA
jgi:hypothetical protein